MKELRGEPTESQPNKAKRWNGRTAQMELEELQAKESSGRPNEEDANEDGEERDGNGAQALEAGKPEDDETAGEIDYF